MSEQNDEPLNNDDGLDSASLPRDSEIGGSSHKALGRASELSVPTPDLEGLKEALGRASELSVPTPDLEGLKEALGRASELSVPTPDLEGLKEALGRASELSVPTPDLEGLKEALGRASELSVPTPDLEGLKEALRRASEVTVSNAELEQRLRETLRAIREREVKLVAETVDIDEDPTAEPGAAETMQRGDSRDLEVLALKLKELSYDPVFEEGGRSGPLIRFELPAGRSSRDVEVLAEDANSLLDELNVTADWRSLQRYDGIWSAQEGVIEVALRFDRFTGSQKHILQRLSSTQTGAQTRTFVVESPEGISMRVGEASRLARILLADRPRQNFATMRLSSVRVSRTEEADEIAEEIGDSFSFATRVNARVGVQLRRLKSTRRRRFRSRIGRNAPIQFPISKYPHAPILMYHAGNDHLSAPPIRYWAYYQVLEYFFPYFTRGEVLRRLSIHLQSPSFNPHNAEDVEKTLQLASVSEGRSVGEREQLAHTIRAIATVEEIVKLITDYELEDHVTDRNSELTIKSLQVSDTSQLLEQLAERVYDIRCRIVHSKDSHREGGLDGPGVIPGTHHDDLVIAELPIIEFLARQAIVSSGQPLHVGWAGN